MGWPKGQGPVRSEASARPMKFGGPVGPMSKAPTFSSQQIRSIKQSPKGQLPKFLQVKTGNNNTAAFATARTKKYAGTIGYDKKRKRVYGSVGKVEN